MGRAVAILVFVASLYLYVNWQYRRVVHQVTSPTASSSAFPAAKTPWSQHQESRTKCLICGGSGRSGFFTPGKSGTWSAKPCSSCRGTGWIDNPMYGH